MSLSFKLDQKKFREQSAANVIPYIEREIEYHYHEPSDDYTFSAHAEAEAKQNDLKIDWNKISLH